MAKHTYPAVWKAFQKAAEAAGIGKLATHTMRHSYRAWLDVRISACRMSFRWTAIGVPAAVTDDMSQAHARVVQMVLSKESSERQQMAGGVS